MKTSRSSIFHQSKGGGVGVGVVPGGVVGAGDGGVALGMVVENEEG